MNMSVFFVDCPKISFLSVLAVFKLLPFIQNVLKLHRIKMEISQNHKYSMVFGPTFLYFVSPKL